MEYKLVVLMRQDLKLPKGKMAAQAAHAAVEATLIALKNDESVVKKWRQSGQKKVVLKVSSEKDIFKYKLIAKDNGLVTAVITDAGRTVVEPGTVTCMAIGPASEEAVDAVTGELQMM